MDGQLIISISPERADPRVFPNIRPVTPVGPEFDIVDVPRGPRFVDGDQLVLGAVEGTHSTIRFVPDTDILEFGVDIASGRQELPDVAPVHADIIYGAVVTVCRELTENCFEKRCELSIRHFT